MPKVVELYATDGKGKQHTIRKGDEVFLDPNTLELTVVPPERQYQARYVGTVMTEETKDTPYKYKSYFKDALHKIAEVHDKKAKDYTQGHREFGNFEDSAKESGVTTAQAIEVLIGTKNARRINLEYHVKDANPVNEPLEDTLLDRAVYCLIRYAHYLYEKDANAPKLAKEDISLSKLAQFGGMNMCAVCKHPKSTHGMTRYETQCSCCLNNEFV